ncbi:MAG: LPS assembly protein LptD [Candidatus Omnitrophica bacterium]|nr:LPS assembly protein LptD [Candidatus Omnitrophota bacterium]
MRKVYKIILRCCFYLLVFGSLFLIPSQVHSSNINPDHEKGFDFKQKNFLDIKPKNVKSVQLEADQVQFSQQTNKAIATGHVVVTAQTTVLYSDQLELEKSVGEAVASGHVYMDSPSMQVDADTATYNFNEGTGEFQNARIFNEPFQIKGEVISKVSENHMVMQDGFLTTCDHDIPHFRIATHRMDVYQKDKAVARGVTMYLGKVPVMYLPQYVQDLKNRPVFTVTPGYRKDFGAFLLTALHLKLSDHVKVLVHGDFRERTGIAEGADVKYETPRFGAGILRTYYTYETQIASNHLWNLYNSAGIKKGPTIRHERYRVEWRHQWKIDKDTSAIWQYYKIHDYDLSNMGFIKKYFEREFRQGPDVNTYFLLTRNLPKGALSFRIDASRVNPALQGVDHFPEIRYDLGGQQLGHTNFYLNTTDTFSNIQNQQPDNHMKTMRMDVNNEISYPKKIAFIEFRPFVGGEHTYYSRTNDVNERSVVRGQFKTGADLTTHFYRMWNFHKNIWGVDINGLRHVVTPSATYGYVHRPTISASHFNQFDSIDALSQSHSVHLSLENKLQTKRGKQSVDLLRTIVETDYQLLKTEPGRSFGPVTSTVEFIPNSWLSFRADENYDNKNKRWNNANFDTYINGGDKWSFGIGKRYARHVDDQITTELRYKINPKWKIKIYDRFLVDKGTIKEEDYALTRDLHEWEMDIDYHQERGAGTGIFVVFRLKAFPNMGIDLFSDSFHQPKAGSQSSTGN